MNDCALYNLYVHFKVSWFPMYLKPTSGDKNLLKRYIKKFKKFKKLPGQANFTQ